MTCLSLQRDLPVSPKWGLPQASQDVADQVAKCSGLQRGGADSSPHRSASSPSAPETASREPPSRPDGAAGQGPAGPGHRVPPKGHFSTGVERDAPPSVLLLLLEPLGTATATQPPSSGRCPSLRILPLTGHARPEDSGARGAGSSHRVLPSPSFPEHVPTRQQTRSPPRGKPGLELDGVRKCPHSPGSQATALFLATTPPQDPGR